MYLWSIGKIEERLLEGENYSITFTLDIDQPRSIGGLLKENGTVS